MNWIPISTAPASRKPFEMFVVIAMGVRPTPTSPPYTSDPYCVWREQDGSFARWPHQEFGPTHWCPLPFYRPAPEGDMSPRTPVSKEEALASLRRIEDNEATYLDADKIFRALQRLPE